MRNILIAAVLAIGLAGCASTTQPLPINKSVVAAENSVGVLANAAAVLVNVCVLDKTTSAGEIVGQALTAAGGTLDTANQNIQDGKIDGIAALIEIAKSALTNAQIAINSAQPTPAQARSMAAAAPKSLGPKSLDTNGIIALINQFLPIILAGGTEIANLVQSFINNVHTPDADVTAAAVAQANASMHLGINNFAASVCVK